jgi:hypothetical protein
MLTQKKNVEIKWLVQSQLSHRSFSARHFSTSRIIAACDLGDVVFKGDLFRRFKIEREKNI